MAETDKLAMVIEKSNSRHFLTGRFTKRFAQMMTKIDVETLIGGIAALIALVAIIFEVFFNGFSQEAVIAGVKDVSTTIVAAVVLVVAVRKLRPKKPALTYEKALEDELAKWVKRYDPMVQRVMNPKPGDPMQYNMITDHEILLHSAEGRPIEEIRKRASIKSTDSFTGLFVDLPSIDHNELRFHINKSTFIKRVQAGMSFEEFRCRYAPRFACAVANNFKNICISAKADKDGGGFQVELSRKLQTPEDAQELVSLIEYVMLLYFLAA